MPDPLKNRRSVHICALFDMIFAVLVLSAYVFRIVMEYNRQDDQDHRITKGFFKPGEKPAVSACLWFLAFVINIAQFTFAYLLFSAVRKEANDLQYRAQLSWSKYWLIFANVIFVMLISKFIFFVFFDKGNDSIEKVIMLILCVTELFFKAYAMYFVKEFVDDLKAAFNVNLPSKAVLRSANQTPRSSV